MDEEQENPKGQMVRAKFKCVSMEKVEGWNGNKFHYNYRFMTVSGNSEENKSFFAATPSGDVKLTAVRADLFEVGKEYYLDFTLA